MSMCRPLIRRLLQTATRAATSTVRGTAPSAWLGSALCPRLGAHDRAARGCVSRHQGGAPPPAIAGRAVWRGLRWVAGILLLRSDARIADLYRVRVLSQDPYRFERQVAQLYRSFGADVRHDVSLAGNQIDVLVTEQTASGSPLTRIVECKAYATPVGVHQVRTFALTSGLLKDRHLADVATIVSSEGFTKSAREAAQEFGVELLEIADLEQRARRATSGSEVAEHVTRSDVTESDRNVEDGASDARLRAFVAIPFTERYDDVYLYGIRGAAERAGITVERADENIDSSEIIIYIKSRISGCDLIVADTTERNANVFYELGYADGLGKDVLLIAEANVDLPFDVRGRNHLVYKSISDLQTRLTDRFTSLSKR